MHVYRDGTVHLNHGGTEMGQGLFIKVAQVVADELGIPVAAIRINACRHQQGAECVCDGCVQRFGHERQGRAGGRAQDSQPPYRVCSAPFLGDTRAAVEISAQSGRVTVGAIADFAELVQLAWFDRIPLSATGFYKTPKINYDRSTYRGRPFFYFAYGAAVVEVIVDTLDR